MTGRRPSAVVTLVERATRYVRVVSLPNGYGAAATGSSGNTSPKEPARGDSPCATSTTSPNGSTPDPTACPPGRLPQGCSCRACLPDMCRGGATGQSDASITVMMGCSMTRARWTIGRAGPDGGLQRQIVSFSDPLCQRLHRPSANEPQPLARTA